jgi:hypothetical protein
MGYFPQLSSGALAQYPVSKRVIRRTIMNTLPDGSSIKLSDSGVTAIEWSLQFSGLSDQEAIALAELFADCEGELNSFGFLDPTGNLLAWSEKFDEDAWAKDPLLAIEGGRPDPLGGANAFLLSNAAAISRSIQQTVNAPAAYRYCFSAWVRSMEQAPFKLRIGVEMREFSAGPDWARTTITSAPAHGDSAVFGVEVQPGTSLEIFGMQAEAQPGASGYKRTGSNGGVYPSARFGEGHLRITSEAPNSHSCFVKVVSNANGL